jgi:hypothetical protein
MGKGAITGSERDRPRSASLAGTKPKRPGQPPDGRCGACAALRIGNRESLDWALPMVSPAFGWESAAAAEVAMGPDPGRPEHRALHPERGRFNSSPRIRPVRSRGPSSLVPGHCRAIPRGGGARRLLAGSRPNDAKPRPVSHSAGGAAFAHPAPPTPPLRGRRSHGDGSASDRPPASLRAHAVERSGCSGSAKTPCRRWAKFLIHGHSSTAQVRMVFRFMGRNHASPWLAERPRSMHVNVQFGVGQKGAWSLPWARTPGRGPGHRHAREPDALGATAEGSFTEPPRCRRQ